MVRIQKPQLIQDLGPGHEVIEASAGTGKTFQIAEIVLRLIIDYNLPLSGILVTTFTRAAAAELKGRIRTRLEKAAFDKYMAAHPEKEELLHRIFRQAGGQLQRKGATL